MRRLVPAPEDFTSRLRSPCRGRRIGLALGISFGVCFLTGLLSHYAQLPAHPSRSRPAPRGATG